MTAKLCDRLPEVIVKVLRNPSELLRYCQAPVAELLFLTLFQSSDVLIFPAKKIINKRDSLGLKIDNKQLRKCVHLIPVIQ